jgi:hypothetical protein
MEENKLTGLALIVAVVGALGKWTMFQNAGEKFLTRLVEGHYLRRMGRRVDLQQWELLQVHEREELDTLAILLQRKWKADRVTVVEYDCSDEKLPALANCTVEQREPHMAAIKASMQGVRLASPEWAEVLRVYSLPSRYLYLPDVSELEVPTLRSRLIKSGVRSAYYQALPTVTGTCGAMLSMSWSTSRHLDAGELESLHFITRNLGATLRAIWAYQKTAA